MPSVTNPPDEPEESIPSSDEWHVLVTAPVEFAGNLIGELSLRGGYILALNNDDSEVSIRARLPASEYEAMADVVAALETYSPARIERER